MTPEIPPLVVGIDGSERSDAFALAARLADPGQHVLLVHVRRDDRSANLTAPQEFVDPATAREMRVVSDSSPATGLHAALATLADGSEVSGSLLEGDAATELAAASAELDLLVLGSRGYGSVRSALLGSVSRARALRRVPGRRRSGGQRGRAPRRPGRAGHYATRPRGVRSVDARRAV